MSRPPPPPPPQPQPQRLSPPPPPPQPQSLLRLLTILDITTSHTLHRIATPIIPTPFLKLLELTGDGRLWFPISLSLLLSPLSRHSPLLYSLSLSLLIGLITDIGLIGLTKHLVRRPRPQHNSHPMPAHLAVDRWSFPSGHASRTCFVAAFFDLSMNIVSQGIDQIKDRNPEILSRWIGEWETDGVVRLLVADIWVWAIVTSASRVLLGRHYVLDVAVGSLVGILNAFFVYHFLMF